MLFASARTSNDTFAVDVTLENDWLVVYLRVEILFVCNPVHFGAAVTEQRALRDMSHRITALWGVKQKCSARMRTHAGLSNCDLRV